MKNSSIISLQFVVSFPGLVLIPHLQFPPLSFLSEKCLQNTSLAAPGALTHRMQRHTARKIKNGHQGAPNWPMWSGKGSHPKLLATPNNFCKYVSQYEHSF